MDLQELLQSPLTDSNRDPLLTIERESREDE
jgi:hypothetical protein